MYFLDKGFKFRAYIRNGVHCVLMMSTNITSIAILNIRGVHYLCVIIILLELDLYNACEIYHGLHKK